MLSEMCWMGIPKRGIITETLLADDIDAHTPDGVILLERNSNKQLHLALETKGSNRIFDLRLKKSLRIYCDKEHFKTLETGIALKMW